MEREAMGASDELPFACKCGSVTGVIEHANPQEGDRVVCHCVDCRDLVRHLGQEARVLDDLGGTDLYQSRCARVKLQSGRDKLASLHMTEGKTLRWYASCCQSPLFNTYANGRVPYVTTLLANTDADKREILLGDPIGHVFPQQATGDASGLRELSFARLMWRFFRRMLKDLVVGDRRRSALFDAKTLEPIAKPRHLTLAEQQALGRA
ncbi:DUF6151 family protein [Erythrobacter sp.]|uniref:DUF6151 family protein n=1 Tax=Erythrobacter sp. TaxID=1042 RepID=UPI00311E737A